MKITRNDTIISVQSPYNPEIPKAAKNIGGNWNGTEWCFDIRDESRVEEVYRNIYGEWDTDTDENTVTVQITATDDIFTSKCGVFFGGRQIAWATGWDSGASLGNGVICIDGGAYSGGSVKNWKTCIDEGSVFEIKDFPVCKVDSIDEDWEIKILGDVNIDKALLEDEKSKLMNRLHEIEKLLNSFE